MLVLLESIAGNLYSNLLVELTVGPFPMKGTYKSSLSIRMRVRLNIEQSARSMFLEALQSRFLINVTMVVILIRIKVMFRDNNKIKVSVLRNQSRGI